MGGYSQRSAGPDVRTAPVSFDQRRLWLLHDLDPQGAGYNLPFAWRIRGGLDVPALERALGEIVRRHEVLRTTFAVIDEEQVQRVAAFSGFRLPVVDLTHVPEGEREGESVRRQRAESVRPFDLARGPLFRPVLLHLGSDEHVLVLTFHHTVFDGWSQGVFAGELRALYEAFFQGKASPLPEPHAQYADFAGWQRDAARGEKMEAQLAYWRRQLTAPRPTLSLPTDRPRPPVRTDRGGTVALTLGHDVVDALRALGREERATLFMALLAIFKAWLYRHCGQEDILTGIPMTGRNWPQAEGLLGCFVNTLVIRTGLAGEPTFRELLRRVRDAARGAYANQDVPFERLVEELRPERDLSRTPLFQALFLFLNMPQRAPELPGLAVQELPVGGEACPSDVVLSAAVKEGAGLELRLSYNTDLFGEATATLMAGRLERLLRAAIADPDARVSRLPVTTDVERRRIAAYNDTGREHGVDRHVHERFEEQARRRPDAVAVSFGGASLTYGDLDRESNRLAHFLRRSGAGPERPVGIAVERSLEMMVGLLAILKAGAAYLPLDTSYPAERLKILIEDSGIELVLTQDRVPLPAHRARVVRLDVDRALWAAEAEESLGSLARPENLSYVIYTSGSTGRPKGVEIRHRAFANFLASVRDATGFGEGDAHLAVATFSFDMSCMDLFLPLTAGGRLVLAARDDAFDAKALIRLLETSGATVMQATPATWRMLIDGGWEGRPGLRVFCGGEALSPDLARALRARVPEVWNLYGPTETTVYSTVHRVVEDGTVPIGLPLANTQIRLLDSRLEPVPMGVPGELHIGGQGLARAYRRRPDLTAERFIPDTEGEPGARLYKTGDLARQLPDGRIEYLGRIDHQVKIRGFRIELGEVEAVLARHPQVRHAVALAREDTPGETRLVGYLVPEGDDAPSVGELRRHLQGFLPEYMVPSAFVVLATLPLSANGKVDRRALPAPDGERAGRAEEFVAPRSETEVVLAEIWRDVLKLEVVGIHHNFFDLGGHSLLATRVLSRVASRLGAELQVTEMFLRPTIAQLAEKVEEVEEVALLGSDDIRIEQLMDALEAEADVPVVPSVEEAG